MLSISNQSAYLVGRDRIVADIPVDHPSISKQHAVIQYRYNSSKNEYGDISNTIKYVYLFVVIDEQTLYFGSSIFKWNFY